MFVLFIICAVLALLALGVALVTTRDTATGPRNRAYARRSAAGFTGLAGLFFLLGSFYLQDPGQANVLRSFTGSIVGYETAEGFHWKAPWVDPITFDVRNQRVVYAGGSGSTSDNTGGSTDGAQITVQDRDGVTSNIDIAIRYSLNPDGVVDIYRQYLNEDNLKTRLIFNDVRSVVRSVPGQFTTLELLTKRDEVQQAIREALELKWEGQNIIVEEVSLQEIRPPQSVQDSYAAAQEAQINVSREQANLEAAEVSAQQKVVQAQAEADANALLNDSLTDRILRQRYLDTLAALAAAGNLVITDGTGSGVLIQR